MIIPVEQNLIFLLMVTDFLILFILDFVIIVYKIVIFFVVILLIVHSVRVASSKTLIIIFSLVINIKRPEILCLMKFSIL